MSFISVRLPDKIAYGAIGGPGYQTDIIVVRSGHEQRNASWSAARYRWEVSQAVQTQADFASVRALFHAVKGRAHSFLFKDHADYTVSASEGALSYNEDEETWQMHKLYTVGSEQNYRKITRPVEGTVVIAGGGEYEVDYSTGVITLVDGNDPSGWRGQFDVPVRFDIDELRAEIVGPGPLLRWSSIPLVEVRE